MSKQTESADLAKAVRLSEGRTANLRRDIERLTGTRIGTREFYVGLEKMAASQEVDSHEAG